MNNRFCRCCFSDRNADDTICRGFLSHLSDNKHSLSSRRSGKRPPLAARGSPLAGLPGEGPPERRTGARQLCPAHGEAGRGGWPERDLLESPAKAQPSRGSPAPGRDRDLPPRTEKAPKDLRPPCHVNCTTDHTGEGKGRCVYVPGPGVTMTRGTGEEKGDGACLDFPALCVCTRAHTHTHTRSQSQSPLLPRSSKGFSDLQRGEAVGIPSSFCYKSHTRPRIPEPPTLVLRVCLAHRCVRVRVRVTINAQAERSPLCGPGRVCGPVTHHALVRQHVWGVGVSRCWGEGVRGRTEGAREAHELARAAGSSSDSFKCFCRTNT